MKKIRKNLEKRVSCLLAGLTIGIVLSGATIYASQPGEAAFELPYLQGELLATEQEMNRLQENQRAGTMSPDQVEHLADLEAIHQLLLAQKQEQDEIEAAEAQFRAQEQKELEDALAQIREFEQQAEAKRIAQIEEQKRQAEEIKRKQQEEEDAALARQLQEQQDAEFARQQAEREEQERIKKEQEALAEQKRREELQLQEDAGLAYALKLQENFNSKFEHIVDPHGLQRGIAFDKIQVQGIEVATNLQRHFPEATIYNVRTSGQQGAQCGPRAVANALGIQNIILHNDGIITNEKQQAASVVDFTGLEVENVETLDLRPLIDRCGLEHAYCIAYSKDRTNPTTGKPKIDQWRADMDNHPSIELSNIKHYNRNMLFHVICNTGGHWIAISVIKRVHKTPIMLFMDTSFHDIQYNDVIFDFMNFLYHECLGL